MQWEGRSTLRRSVLSFAYLWYDYKHIIGVALHKQRMLRVSMALQSLAVFVEAWCRPGSICNLHPGEIFRIGNLQQKVSFRYNSR